MKQIVSENNKVSPYLLLFLIHSAQTGIGILTFQSDIVKGAGQDAWMSIIVVGLCLHLFLRMIFAMLKRSTEGDIVSLHRDIFGTKVSVLLNLALCVYFFFSGLIIVHSYIEILQIWVFVGIPTWEFSFWICFVVFYIVSGGFRIITGISFFGVILPTVLLFSIIYIVLTIDTTFLLPLFNHTLKEYAISAWHSAFMFFGMESILLFFPFIKNVEKGEKWGHLGLLMTTVLYVVTALVTFAYFAKDKLDHLVWPTLTMIKVLSFPFLERFEFLFIFTWLLIIIPSVCLNIWAATRLVKRTIPKINANYLLIALLIMYFLFNSFVIDTDFTVRLFRIITTSGIFIITIYIPFMFILSLLKGKKQ